VEPGDRSAPRVAAWGDCAIGDMCLADFDADGQVGTTDLLDLLAVWGSPCNSGGSPPQSVTDCLERYTDPLAIIKCIEAVN